MVITALLFTPRKLKKVINIIVSSMSPLPNGLLCLWKRFSDPNDRKRQAGTSAWLR